MCCHPSLTNEFEKMKYDESAIGIFLSFIRTHYLDKPLNRADGRFDHNLTNIVEIVISQGTPQQARRLIQAVDTRLAPMEFQVLIEIVAFDRKEASKLLADEEVVLGPKHSTILKQD